MSMSSDPRWAAYVLSELDEAETAQVEKELEASADAREEVARLRETAALLGLALDTLPAFELSPESRRHIADASRREAAAMSGGRVARSAADRPTWRRVAFAGMTAGALGVAAVALMIAQWLAGGRPLAQPVMSAGLPGLAAAQTVQQPLEMRLEISTPPTNTPASFAISPDGRAIVYVAMTQPFAGPPHRPEATGNAELFLRRLDDVSHRLLARGHLMEAPFWSPDGRSVAFFADGKLKRVGVEGGTPVVLADAPRPRGGTWAPDGTILFAPRADGPIMRIPAAGGAPVPATRVRGPARGHRFPRFVSGTTFLFHAGGDEAGIFAASLGSLEARRLIAADDAVPLVGLGQLLFVRQRALLAQPFDAERLQLTGTPRLVAEDVIVDGLTGAAALSASVAGPIVFRAWPPEQPTLAEAGSVALSPDGRWIAYRRSGQQSDIWVRSLQGVEARVSPDGRMLIWRADGSEIFFVDANGRTMSAGVQQDSDGRGIKIQQPKPLFPDSPAVAFAKDGRRVPFGYRPLVVILNWDPGR
jgi:hypothetical protein